MTKVEEGEALISVSKTVLGWPKTVQEKIKIRPFVTDTARVGVKLGRLINIGNYENLKIEVFMSCPCYAEEMLDVYNMVKETVAGTLDKEVLEIMAGING